MSGTIVRALKWDVGYEQRFLTASPAGNEVVLYLTFHENPASEPSINKVTSRGGFENIQCLSYSQNNHGMTGVGTISGTVQVFDITGNNSSIVKLRPKQNRPCNSVCFNNEGLVAAGFDKSRQDNSVQVWNMEHYSRSSNNDHIRRPTYSFVPNEAVLLTVFCPEKDSALLTGSYKLLREYDLRSDSPAFQVATKNTLGIAYDHFQAHLFSSYSEDGSVAIWDKRKLTSSAGKLKLGSLGSGILLEAPVLHFSKLLSDSSRKNYKPCFRHSSICRGEFSAVFNGNLIRRWNTGAIPASLSVAVPLEVSRDENENLEEEPEGHRTRAVVASLKKQAFELYRPDQDLLFVTCVLDAKTDFERVISFDYSSDLKATTATNFVCMRASGSVFTMPAVETIEAMAFNSYNEFVTTGPQGTQTKFMTDKLFSVSELENTAPISSARRAPIGAHEVALKEDLQPGYAEDMPSTVDDDDSVLQNFRNSRNLLRYPGFDYEDEEDDYEEEDFLARSNLLDISKTMASDICTTIRKRAVSGYAFDFDTNVRVLEELESIDNQQFLRNTWKWLALAKKSLDKGTMVSQGIDLGYQGVLGIWRGFDELRDQNRFSSEMGSPTDQWFSNAIKAIVSNKGQKTAGINIPSNSERKAQRKLCLIVSGWYLADTEFEEKLSVLVSLGFYEKAAGWAVFHGNVNRAIEILASSKKERLRLISTAVAGYLAYKTSNVNSPWKDQCRKMASELDDPYLRAIFAFIADNDWWDVLDEHSLPLRERLGVALRFLSDKDLTVYLNRVADTVVSKGELEGLILTGITPRGIDLLQSYVDRTSDVQTAALITAFGVPRYFMDERVNHWLACYRDLLNSWGLFSVRARFDVNRTKLSRNGAGALTLTPAPKQVFLQCIRCNKNISKNRAGGGASATSSANGGSSAPNNNSMLLKQFNKMAMKTHTSEITACPHCGAPLPRCSICLLTLGTPIPLDEPMSDAPEVRAVNHFRERFTFCLSCNHGAHAHHAEEWFSKHYVCPVPDCNCRCNSK